MSLGKWEEKGWKKDEKREKMDKGTKCTHTDRESERERERIEWERNSHKEGERDL